jgi:formylmethanofuran dehydrogenase subunit E
MKVCGRSVEDSLEEIRRFHGFVAPGLLIGTLMIDWALDLLDHNT